MPERRNLGGLVTIGLVGGLAVSALINKVAEGRANKFDPAAPPPSNPGLVVPTAEVYQSNVVLPTVTAEVSACAPPAYHRDVDLQYAGKYYFPGELDSFPMHQEGQANYYSYEEGAGTLIGHGEPFNPMGMTAASWFYPIDTIVRVTRLDTGASILVRINDRGPHRIKYPNVIIDLAEGAMRALDPRAGSLQVSVEPLCPQPQP